MLLLTSPPCLCTGYGHVGRGIGLCWERKSRGPKDARSSPSSTELRGDPSPCPQPTAMSPARGGARPGAGDSLGLGLGLSSEQGPTGQGSVSGVCSPTEAHSRPREVLSTLPRHECVPGPGDSHVPAAPAPCHGRARGMLSSCHGHASPSEGLPCLPTPPCQRY